jgi:hypothetical protein
MEMVKLCSYFLLIKCLGSSAWPERCLGKAKVAGSIPAQGFLFRPKESQFEEIREHYNEVSTLPNSVRILPKSVRTNVSQIDWVAYKQYLGKNFNNHTAKARFSYSTKYCQILLNEDASSLVVLSFDKRMHIMKALATLSKFLGCYDQWKKIVGNYQLRWSDNGSGGATSKGLEIFHNIYGNSNYQEMIIQLKDACFKLGQKYSSVLLYCTLTGLRPAEACVSIRLLKERKEDYLTKDLKVLEHFRFPEVFMRRTKNAYFSITFEKLLEIINHLEPISYNSLRLALRRQSIKLNISICRKIFATFLRSEGIETEMVDLLQGRIAKSVFVRHYYRPDSSKFDLISVKLTKLHELIIPK